MSRRIKENLNKSGVNRPGSLEYMAWAGTGMIWRVSGGIPNSKASGQTPNPQMGGSAGFSFVQISDSHIGFDKATNPDVTATLQQAIDKINTLDHTPDFLIHPGDLSHLSKPNEFDTLDQALKSAKSRKTFFVPGVLGIMHVNYVADNHRLTVVDSALSATPASRASLHNIFDTADLQIDNLSFAPKSITVRAGKSVTWTNRDDSPHNVVSTQKKSSSPVLDTGPAFSFRLQESGSYRTSSEFTHDYGDHLGRQRCFEKVVSGQITTLPQTKSQLSRKPNRSLSMKENSSALSLPSGDEGPLKLKWRRVVRRRSFLQGLSAAAAILPAVGLGARQMSAAGDRDWARNDRPLTRGDAAILRLAAAIELIEADLWQQYNELGGAVDPNDNANPGNPSYLAALANLDGDMPQYISDNTDDEISHAAFLNAYLESKGEQPVSFKVFQTIPPSRATGANQNLMRITNLQSLNVDTSWYFRYRSTQNPDLGAQFPQLLNIKNQPAIPVSDADTDAHALVPLLQSLPITDPKARRIQSIANTAALHFAFIEQGGSSLYPVLALKATSLEVLRILLSIGGVEIDHFSLWHDKGGNAIEQPLAGPNGLTDPETGLTFPDFNNPANQHNANLLPPDQTAGSQMFQTNLILPEPVEFLNKNLPPVSIIRPTSVQDGGAVATIQAFISDNLFFGQKNQQFFRTLLAMANAADEAMRDWDS